jgi:hypothetical protein
MRHEPTIAAYLEACASWSNRLVTLGDATAFVAVNARLRGQIARDDPATLEEPGAFTRYEHRQRAERD